jgi:hypothetical protein
LTKDGLLVTIGWDEDFNDELTEVWYRFVIEEECYFDTLPEYRRRKRNRIKSPRNCGLTTVKRKLRVPVKFSTNEEAAIVFGHLFGYDAGIWVLENSENEFNMSVSITKDDKNSIRDNLESYKLI